MRCVSDAIASTTLAAASGPEALARMLDVMRSALRAEHAVLVCRDGEGAASPVHAVPAMPSLDADTLAGAPAADEPTVPQGHAGPFAVLVVGLRPRIDARWGLVLARRAGEQWTADERAEVLALRPHLVLALELALLREQLAAERERAAAAAAAEERLLRAVSHELRNPLAPILMWTSTLKRLRADDAEVLRATKAIEHAVGLERRLIEDLVDVSRLQRGILELRRETVDLCDVVRQAIAVHRQPVEEAGLSLVNELPPAGLRLDGDPRRLVQVVGNLLANAVKFTPQGGGIAVSLRRHGDEAELRVSDTGGGFPAELLPAAFTPFVQGPNARGGLGVGLAVAERLVVLHGGRLDVLPAGDLGGATFVVRLPLVHAWHCTEARA
jgi:signal transduction histidine kinase